MTKRNPIMARIAGVIAMWKGAKTPHEKDAFEKKMNLLLDKYGMTLKDFVGEDVEAPFQTFKFNGEFEYKLLIQLAAMSKREISISNIRKAKTMKIRLTDLQYIEMKAMYETYLGAWRIEQESLFKAFLSKHHLFSGLQGVKQAETPEEIAEMERRELLKAGLRHVNSPRTVKQLEAAK